MGEAIYVIVRHQDHTNLVYALKLPEDLGEAQKALGIKSEASYIMTIKNPEASSPKGTGLPTEEKAEILNDLRMRKSRHPIEPLFTREWC